VTVTGRGSASRIAGTLLRVAYRLFAQAVTPALPLLYRRRVTRGKEDPARRGERFGRATLSRPKGPLVWLHAASVGEMNAADALIAPLLARGVTVLLTTGTLTSARIAAKRARAGLIHQFVPYDTPAGIGRFLDHWRPDLALTVESEIWPTTVVELDRRRIPLAIVSATLSDRSARGWARVRPFALELFSRVTLCLAQTEADAARLRALGAGDVRVTGNLKFDAPPPDCDRSELERLSTLIGARPVWLAASTHDGEEEIVAQVHATLAARLPGLLTILAPRHPERGDGIAERVRARGIALAQRSRGEAPAADIGVYLADTIGEMGLFLRLAPIAFIGKSLVPEGGQNPLEAARLDTAILSGPHVFNLEVLYAPLIADGGVEIVADAPLLADALADLLGDPQARAAQARAARKVAARGSGALASTLEALAPLLPSAPGESDTGRVEDAP